MHPQLQQIEIIGLMAAHETAVGDLYEAYAQALPEHGDLFLELVRTERDHARALASFADDVRAGRARVDADRFSAPVVLESLDIVRALLAEAERKPVSTKAALVTATELEESLLEKHCFQSLASDSPELTAVLQRLDRETADHRARLREALAQHGE